MGFGKTILIIGDEQNLRTTLAAILQRAGYVITTSGSPDQALEYLNEKCFDLVILDLKITGSYGVELVPEIKRKHPETPVILLTSTAMRVIPELIDGPAAPEYLVKPIDPERIVALANEMIINNRPDRYKTVPSKDAPPAPDDPNLLKN